MGLEPSTVATALLRSDAFETAAGRMGPTLEAGFDREWGAKFDSLEAKAKKDKAELDPVEVQKARDAIAAKYTPKEAPTPVIEKLACVLKSVSAGPHTRMMFNLHFAQASFAANTKGIWDAATPGDVTLGELARLGLHSSACPERLQQQGLARHVGTELIARLIPNGDIYHDYRSVLSLLKFDQALTGGRKLELNVMSGCLELDRTPVYENKLISDTMLALATNYSVAGMKGHSVALTPTASDVSRALTSIGLEHQYHPVKEYFISLREKWDGDDYISWLPVFMGIDAAQDSPQMRLAESQIKKTLLSLVARTLTPGCKVDTMLVLKGDQGKNKSKLFALLAPLGSFTDSEINPSDKDTLLKMEQKAICEWAELSGLNKADQESTKRFLSSASDTYRRPYDRAAATHPRWSILVGTTNEEEFLKDPSGSRRFWTVKLADAKIDLKAIAAMKEQLWAQAVALYDAAERCSACQGAADGDQRCPEHRWWLTDGEETVRVDVNKRFTVVLPYSDWFDSIDWNPRVEVKLNELAKLCRGAEWENDPLLHRQLGQVLRVKGYQKTHTHLGNVWRSPEWKPKPVLVDKAENDEAIGATDRTYRDKRDKPARI